MEEPKYVKVTNEGKPIYHDWNLTLFTEDEAAQWDNYLKQQEATVSPDEWIVIKKRPLPERLQEWATAMNMGLDPYQEDLEAGVIKMLPANYKPKKKFKLPLGDTILTEKQSEHFKKFLKKNIKQKAVVGDDGPVYESEGFITMEPHTPKPAVEMFACPDCDKEFKSKLALTGHSRTHASKTK